MKGNPNHIRTENMLREAGWMPLRQLTPRKEDTCITGEWFEMWRKDAHVLVIHFMGENGVDFYSPIGGATWTSVEAAIKAIK